MTVEQITELECKKHVKIFKLKELGKTNKEIAELLSTNPGHVYNALKKYDENPSLKDVANSLTA